MPSELDRRLDRALAALTGPAGQVATRPADDGRGSVAAALPATLPAFFATFCALNAAVEAVVSGPDRLTYADLDRLSEQVARTLAGRGVAKGDRVAIAMRNCTSWIVGYMAALKAGAIATLVNGWWVGEELAHAMRLTDPVLVIADAERARRIGDAGGGWPIVTLEIDRPAADALLPLIDPAHAAAALPAVAPDDEATILFTSGSTGRAKGAVSTHRAVTSGVYAFLSFQGSALAIVTEDEGPPALPHAVLVAVPLFHVTGMVPVMLDSFCIARKMVLMRRWDAGEALRLIEAEKITYFIGVPTMSLEMMQHPAIGDHDLSSLADIAAGGAARPPAHVEPLAAAFPRGNPLLGYGLTETNAAGCTNHRANYRAKPNSTGRVHRPFLEIAIVDDAGAALPPGATGEIAFRGSTLFSGYWRDPAATARAFAPDGWFRTGDAGYLDEDGYLFIVDRLKDVIIRGGENIAAPEVEAALYAHPAVAEASVFGLPDARLGEVPAAAVHLKAGGRATADELLEGCARRLAAFKVPARLWLSAEPLPKLGTGKIDKRSLRQAYAEEEA